MADTPPLLVTIWEDTVDMRALSIGVVLGAVLGFASYLAASRALAAALPGQTTGVIKGYALMGGILGCVCAAVGVALMCTPKRVLRTSSDEPIDREEVIRRLALDPVAERQALAQASPRLVREMQQLHIYELFAEPATRQEAE